MAPDEIAEVALVEVSRLQRLALHHVLSFTQEVKMDFLIDTPSHKRWMLPDGEHYYNSVIHGDYIYETVWDIRSNSCVVSVQPIYLDGAGKWKEHCELAQALAEKRFRKR